MEREQYAKKCLKLSTDEQMQRVKDILYRPLKPNKITETLTLFEQVQFPEELILVCAYDNWYNNDPLKQKSIVQEAKEYISKSSYTPLQALLPFLDDSLSPSLSSCLPSGTFQWYDLSTEEFDQFKRFDPKAPDASMSTRSRGVCTLLSKDVKLQIKVECLSDFRENTLRLDLLRIPYRQAERYLGVTRCISIGADADISHLFDLAPKDGNTDSNRYSHKDILFCHSTDSDKKLLFKSQRKRVNIAIWNAQKQVWITDLDFVLSPLYSIGLYRHTEKAEQKTLFSLGIISCFSCLNDEKWTIWNKYVTSIPQQPDKEWEEQVQRPLIYCEEKKEEEEDKTAEKEEFKAGHNEFNEEVSSSPKVQHGFDSETKAQEGFPEFYEEMEEERKDREESFLEEEPCPPQKEDSQPLSLVKKDTYLLNKKITIEYKKKTFSLSQLSIESFAFFDKTKLDLESKIKVQIAPLSSISFHDLKQFFQNGSLPSFVKWEKCLVHFCPKENSMYYQQFIEKMAFLSLDELLSIETKVQDGPIERAKIQKVAYFLWCNRSCEVTPYIWKKAIQLNQSVNHLMEYLEQRGCVPVFYSSKGLLCENKEKDKYEILQPIVETSGWKWKLISEKEMSKMCERDLFLWLEEHQVLQDLDWKSSHFHQEMGMILGKNCFYHTAKRNWFYCFSFKHKWQSFLDENVFLDLKYIVP